jgi:hypothetical protein
MRVKGVLLLCLLGTVIAQAQSTPPPVLFFSDLIYAHATGNSDPTHGTNQGDYVTLYGNWLDSYSSIKLNGASCLTVISGPTAWRWYEKMVVQIGSSCATGNFSITTPSGTWSGPMVSTINHSRSSDITIGSTGGIYFIASSGSDSAAGSWSAPWVTTNHAYETLGASAGNTVYLKNGFVQYIGDYDAQSWGAVMLLRPTSASGGTVTMPNAFVGYPGGTAQIGCNASTDSGSCATYGLRMVGTSGTTPMGWWTFAEITWRSYLGSVVTTGGGIVTDTSCSSWNGGVAGCSSRNWRFVGNDISSPNSSGGTAFQTDADYGDEIYGNYVHDIVLQSTSNLDQAYYASTDSNEVDFGWNEIYNNQGRSGIQVHSSPTSGTSDGRTQYGIHLHDNMIHHIQADAIQTNTTDPSLGSGSSVYNNVLWDCGLGPGGQSFGYYPCATNEYGIEGAQALAHSPPPIWWYNNTICAGSRCGGSALGVAVWGDSFPPSGNWYGTTSGLLATTVSNNILIASSETQAWGNDYFDPRDYSDTTCLNAAIYDNQYNTNHLQCPEYANTNLEFGNDNAGTNYPNTYPNINLNSIHQDPKIVAMNNTAPNFHLQSLSPAIGAGLHTITDGSGTKTITAPTYDIDGRIRPNPPSIGAYEYSGSTNSTPNPPTGLSATVH